MTKKKDPFKRLREAVGGAFDGVDVNKYLLEQRGVDYEAFKAVQDELACLKAKYELICSQVIDVINNYDSQEYLLKLKETIGIEKKVICISCRNIQDSYGGCKKCGNLNLLCSYWVLIKEKKESEADNG